jgi:hypothetical protein
MNKLLLLVFALLLIGCTVRHQATAIPDHEPAKWMVKLQDFPSWDTSALIYYLVDGIWYKNFTYRVPGKVADKPTRCEKCDSAFDKSFFKQLSKLKSEDEIKFQQDCTEKTDSIIDGKKYVIYKMHYTFDSPGETISLKLGKEIIKVRFFEPRNCVPYCRNNEERIKFIHFSDILRGLQ